MNLKTVLGGGLILSAIAFFIMNKKPKTEVYQAPAKSGSHAPAVQTPVKQEIVESAQPVLDRGKLQQERQAYAAVILTGIKEIETKKVGTNLKFRFRPKSEPIFCTLGDFDYIRGAVDSLTKDVMLLSIEPINGDKTKSVHYRVSMKDIANAKTFDVQLPVEKKARDYGVYLCMDYQKTNECGSKKLLGSGEWNAAIRSEKDLDRSIYYQMITVAADKAYLIPSKRWDGKSMDKMKKLLSPIVQNLESIDLLKKNIEQLQSVPGRVAKDTLELLLPHKDPKC
jgi:hypothetical protein